MLNGEPKTSKVRVGNGFTVMVAFWVAAVMLFP